MTPEELLLSRRELISTTSPKELLATFRSFKRPHSFEDQQLLGVGMDLYGAGLPLEPKSRSIVVALIHGIQTTGEWQEMVRTELREEQGVVVAPIGYGFLDLVRFLDP
jgi:hypothetical protein